MLRGFHGRQPTSTLTPDEFEARSDWWVSSRRYFDGHIHEPARIPHPINQHNEDDVPSDFYREFVKHKRALKQMMQKDAGGEQMYNKINKFIEEMEIGTTPQPKKGPIMVEKHYGFSDFSGLQNTPGFQQGGPTMCTTQASTSFFEGVQATPSYGHHMSTSNWKTPMPSHLDTPNWQTPMPQPRNSPCTRLPPTTVLPKKQGDKSRNKETNANLSPFNLRNAIIDDNVDAEEVMITGVCQTNDYIVYESVDPSKVTKEPYTPCIQFMLDPYHVYLDSHIMCYSAPELFWRELVPNLYIGGYHELADPNTE
ncbi:hypothetical protein Tco_1470543, partial [Tanacetum coccineum]